MTNSSTNDSLVDAQINGKSFTPSMTSSGYDSQAVSSQTLSSEDSASVRSMSIDDTPELDGRKAGNKTGMVFLNKIEDRINLGFFLDTLDT